MNAPIRTKILAGKKNSIKKAGIFVTELLSKSNPSMTIKPINKTINGIMDVLRTKLRNFKLKCLQASRGKYQPLVMAEAVIVPRGTPSKPNLRHKKDESKILNIAQITSHRISCLFFPIAVNTFAEGPEKT